MKIRLAALNVALLTSVCGPALAASPTGLEEIIVTAQGREQNLKVTPVTVSAISGETIAESGSIRLEDLTRLIPAVQFGAAGIQSNLFIRGIGSGTNQGFEQSVGTFVDGVYYGRDRQVRGPLLDIARLEVLKGPQSILFGKNTISGALSLATGNPGSSFETIATGYYEPEYDEKMLDLVISGPVTERFGARLALRFRDADGYVRNTTSGKDEPGAKDAIARLTLAWQATDTIKANFKLETSRFKEIGRSSQISFCAPALRAQLAVQDPREDCTFNDTLSAGGGGQFGIQGTDTRMTTAALNIEAALGSLTFKSTSGYAKYDYTDLLDPDNTRRGLFLLDVRENYDQWSQEFRLSSPADDTLSFIAGVFFMKTDLAARFDSSLNLAELGNPTSGTRASDYYQDAESASVFVQGQWRITQTLSLRAGLRYTTEEKDALKTQVIADVFQRTLTRNPGTLGFFAGPFSSNNHVLRASRSEDNTSPLIGLDWKPTDDLFFYATYQTGYKAGGFDAGLTDGNPAFFQYRPEEAKSYEIGLKATLPGGNADINIAAFHTTYENLQVSSFNGGFGFRVGNAAEATSQGVEVTGRWRPIEPLRISGNLSYLDSTYDSFRNAQCYAGQTVAQGCVAGAQNLGGQRTQFAPEWSGTLSAVYEASIASDLTLSVGADATYKDDTFLPLNHAPLSVQEAFWKYNARIALAPEDQRWEVALIGKNLSDETTASWSGDLIQNAGSYFKFTDPPRTIALQATFKLGS